MRVDVSAADGTVVVTVDVESNHARLDPVEMRNVERLADVVRALLRALRFANACLADHCSTAAELPGQPYPELIDGLRTEHEARVEINRRAQRLLMEFVPVYSAADRGVPDPYVRRDGPLLIHYTFTSQVGWGTHAHG